MGFLLSFFSPGQEKKPVPLWFVVSPERTTQMPLIGFTGGAARRCERAFGEGGIIQMARPLHSDD